MEHNIHIPQIEEIKTHFKKNKKFYIVGGISLTVGAVGGACLMSGGVQIVDAFKLVNWKSSHTSMTVLIRRGHPGNIIKCLETGELFASQNRAASLNGISASNLSQHLSGKYDHAGGLHFEKLGEAIAA